MGYSQFIVLTPYMEITKNPTALREVKDIIYICSNIECKQHKNQKQYKCKFCPDCGSPIGPFEKISHVEDAVDIEELMFNVGKEDLFFHHPDLDVYIPNYLKAHKIDADEDDVKEIDSVAPQSAIEALCEDPLYKKFFLMLCDNKVEYVIKYGLITYQW